MAVSTPVTLKKIKAEFSGPNNFSAYVRGGSYVPDNATNSKISTTRSGLRMSTFAGAANVVVPPVELQPVFISDFRPEFDFADPMGLFILNSDGNAYRGTSSISSALLFKWLNTGSAGDYQVQFNSGSWLSLSSSRSVSHQISRGSSTVEYTVRIRRAGTTAILASSTVTIQLTKGQPI